MNETKIRGNRIAYQDLHPQKEEVILLIHGHPFDHSMWKYQYETLQDFRLILPDLKGYGQSDYDFEKIYIEGQALDLALLLDELQIEQVHLMGLSMGGQIMVEFQRLFPARVKSMVICASTPNAETAESYPNRLQLAEAILRMGMPKYTEQDIHKYIHLEEVGLDSAVYQHLFNMMSQTSKKGAAASHRGRAERRDNFPYLRNIEVPTLVIAGEKDYFFSVDAVEKVAKDIKGAQFHVIENAGHLPNMEQPEKFNGLIKTFYSAI